MDYNFKEIEARWRRQWAEKNTYKVTEDAAKPKYYVLNMFPYPSGAGLHVGHPLGYIASDIYARYKRLRGFNVLNPMGYDAYGLPAEQYAIQTGQHPAKTTEQNIARYREQLDKIGFSFDWDREVRTCDPKYYHWTQWAFRRMFLSYYCNKCQSAQPIENLVAYFQEKGTEGLDVAQTKELSFTAEEWNAMTQKEKEEVLMNYRIAYLGETMVNWCPALGTVLANDEVVDGVSVRGGHPVVQKKMKQWCLRVSAYAQRLLDGLEDIDWTDSLKETQRNWIGRSEGTEMRFRVAPLNPPIRGDSQMPLYDPYKTASPDRYGILKEFAKENRQYPTEAERALWEMLKEDNLGFSFRRQHIIGDYIVDFVCLSRKLIVEVDGAYHAELQQQQEDAGRTQSLEKMGFRVIRFTNEEVIADTKNVLEKIQSELGTSPVGGRQEGALFSLNGLSVKQAIAATKKYVTEQGLGRVKVNYRLRDAIFSRQRYWGEPFPIYYKDGMPQVLPEECLPLELPEVSKFLPTETGEPPLGNAQLWAWDTESNKVVDKVLVNGETVFPLELSTMPGFAGSSAYYLRYMDPHNDEALVSREADEYWKNVDLYVGGSEHATGHLIYSRFWNKFLFDIGVSCEQEPFRKLVNQGMIQGRSNFVYRIKDTNTFVSLGLKDEYDTTPIHVDVNIVQNDVLDIEAFRNWRPEYADAEFVLEDGKYVCGWAVEKMSKSMYNVVNPDLIVEKYGADTLRIYEMFLGPINQSKPWDSNGIDGSFRFLRRFWNLFFSGEELSVTDVAPGKDNLKTLHKLIKKVTEDIEVFSYNTSVPAFMVATTELAQQKCRSREVLETALILLAPFAPHICEELWHLLGNEGTVFDAAWPQYDEQYLKEDTLTLPVSFSGKTRYTIEVAADATNEEVEKIALSHDSAPKYLEGKQIVKIIVVPKRIVNIVVK